MLVRVEVEVGVQLTPMFHPSPFTPLSVIQEPEHCMSRHLPPSLISSDHLPTTLAIPLVVAIIPTSLIHIEYKS
jgi:hypothetical protein